VLAATSAGDPASAAIRTAATPLELDDEGIGGVSERRLLEHSDIRRTQYAYFYGTRSFGLCVTMRFIARFNTWFLDRGCEEDMIGKRQLTITIEALYAMMEQDNTHSCRDYLNDGNCIREDEVPTTSDEHVSKKLTAEDRADR
jgi:hypothetical protein